jgi:hypothetical protein
MSELAKLTKTILHLCQGYSLYVEDSANGNFRIFTDPASGITLFIKIKEPTDFSFYFLERTYDILYNGDRTDVHVVISLMFASFLRAFDSKISSSLFDIAHPIVDDEIWGRYVIPEQAPLLLGISNWSQLQEAIVKIIMTMVFWREIFWHFAGCPCKECLKATNLADNVREYDLPKEMVHSKNKQLKSTSNLNYGSRIKPSWSYFYDIKNEITVIKSEELSSYYEYIKNLDRDKLERVEGVNGKLFLQEELKNFISNNSIRELKRVIRALGQNTLCFELNILPLENMLILVSKPYIIALGRLCGINEFKTEREFLRARHNDESRLLFPVSLFEWEENVSPEQFEGLIKALLEREPNVRSVRKASPTNQGDAGRDLLIEWSIRNEGVMSDNHPPISIIKVVGQCKASNKTIGKNKVMDIRDTIETHNSQGYFLAVSSQLTAPMTEKLEDLKSKGLWSEWWNREDIEIRLSKNQDLLPSFPKVVKANYQIKFVQMD